MSETLSAVVAGSKGFVDAVQGHLKMRLGAAPRVARDPQEALRACADKGGLLVLEYAGGPWLEAVKNLRGLCGDAALSIVAAVPLAQAADVQPLQRAGVDEVVSWQGRADPVLWAVDRIVDRQSAQQNAAPLPAPDSPKEGEIETGFELCEIPVEDTRTTSTPAPILSSAPRVPANPAAPVPAVPWPNAVPGAAAAEALLLSVSAGQGAGDANQLAAAERVLAAASELERSALVGAEVPVDPALLRATAALRLRLDLALSTLPAADGAVDQPAAQQLLVEVDGVLDQVKALAASAPAGVAPALEPMRLAIVDGGVKLAGALSRLVPVGVPQTAPMAAKQESGTRVLSNDVEVSRKLRARSGLFIALVAVALLTLSYHGWQYAKHQQPVAPPTLPGAPAHTFVVTSAGTKTLLLEPGKKLDAAELESFRALEQAKGNRLRELGQGAWVVEPEVSPGGGAKP